MHPRDAVLHLFHQNCEVVKFLVDIIPMKRKLPRNMLRDAHIITSTMTSIIFIVPR